MKLTLMFSPLIKKVLRPSMAMRKSQLEALPVPPGRVLFLGDSITEQGIWGEWFPEMDVVNQGIGGDSVAGVHARLDTAVVQPVAISLLVGTNDLSGLGKSPKVNQIAEQTRALVTDIQARASGVPFLLHSVMPRKGAMAQTVRELNREYAAIAAAAGVTYVDLWPTLADSEGALRSEFTSDHLHLNGAGYRAWVGVLRPLLAPFAVRPHIEPGGG